MSKREIKPRTGMPEQPPEERVRNFDEVALGYTEEMAVQEASRCLACKKQPCVRGCPVNVNIPAFVKAVTERDFETAAAIVAQANALAAVCGRVCPQEEQCEKYCVMAKVSGPVAIGRLERFVADWAAANTSTNGSSPRIKRGRQKVAILGSGPAGLTCAGDLAAKGYRVTVFEALHELGGVLRYGIPEFRLPREILDSQIESIRKLGVEFLTNAVVGRTVTIPQLLESGYDAVFIGTGAGLPTFLGIPGENLNGVYAANEFLTRVNLMKARQFPIEGTPLKIPKHCAVIGAGNTAMDAARTARRLGAEKVTIAYRRSREEMPARTEELHHAEEEGIEFRLLTNPIEFLGDEQGWLTGMKCVQMELGEPDESGRRRPMPIEGSEFEIPVDTAIVAVGQSPNPLIRQTTADLEVSRHGTIVADEDTGATSVPGIFAGGDVATGAATVITAMGAGRRAADAIDEYLAEKRDG